MVTEEPTTADAIVQAARRAMVERGTGRLTMSAVAEAAGVSRPTLYHWFPSKAALLGAVALYEEQLFDAGLKRVVDTQRTPRRRLEAALRYLVTYIDNSPSPDPVGADPEATLVGLATSLRPHAESLARLLGDALLEVPAVQVGALSGEQAAELFLRMAYSHYLIPHPEPEVLLATMCDFAQISRRSARLLAG
jgi:AcrR family transcriptional regulator